MRNISDRPRERFAHIDGLGVVRVGTARCDCGRPLEPRDFESTDDGVRVVCPACHSEAFRAELDVTCDEV